jgi:hypothetical protein
MTHSTNSARIIRVHTTCDTQYWLRATCVGRKERGGATGARGAGGRSNAPPPSAAITTTTDFALQRSQTTTIWEPVLKAFHKRKCCRADFSSMHVLRRKSRCTYARIRRECAARRRSGAAKRAQITRCSTRRASQTARCECKRSDQIACNSSCGDCLHTDSPSKRPHQTPQHANRAAKVAREQ